MATVIMEPGLELEDIWQELAAEPQHLLGIDEENTSDLEGNADLQAEALYNSATILEFDHYGNLEEATLLGSYHSPTLFADDMFDLLSLQKYPSRASDVATTLESVLHEAIVKYSDNKDNTAKKSNKRGSRKGEPHNKVQHENVIYPEAIADFWDGWILENNVKDLATSSLEVNIEEELNRANTMPTIMTTNTNSIYTIVTSPSSSSSSNTPSGSPIAPSPASPIIEISDEEDLSTQSPVTTVAPKPSRPLVVVDKQSQSRPTTTAAAKKRVAKKSVPTTASSTTVAQPVTLSSSSAGTQLKRRKLNTTQPQQLTIRSQNTYGVPANSSSTFPSSSSSSSINSLAVLNKTESASNGTAPLTKRGMNGKSKKKLAFKPGTLDEVFKVEQVLKISKAVSDESCEDELIDIGDFSDCIHN